MMIPPAFPHADIAAHPRLREAEAPIALSPEDAARLSRAEGAPLNLSRRVFLGAAAGLTLAVAIAPRSLRAAENAAEQIAPGTRVPAFLEIRPDGSILLRSPFVEGGQGVYTAMAQLVAEDLDADIAAFEVVTAPAGPDYLILNGMRFTGGSFSTRSAQLVMRKLGASARGMLIAAAAEKLGVPAAELSTTPGKVVHAASGRELSYGDLAEAAAGMPAPADPPLKTEGFRYIGVSVPRMDVRAKSTGKAVYGIDLTAPDMLLAAVQHAPRLGLRPASVTNLEAVRAMRGVHDVHLLSGAVAVTADRWWRAKKAVEAAQVEWEAAPDQKWPMAADFSSAGFRAALAAQEGEGAAYEAEGDAAAALAGADRIVEAVYDAPYLAHAQLEPPSALAAFAEDGSLDLWSPNQAPELFQGVAAGIAGLEPGQVRIHSPMLGGFFGRHFLYEAAEPFPQAIQLAKATGRPVKVIWSREEEFLRDALRPLAHARFRAALGPDGMPVALAAEAVGEGPIGRYWGAPPGKDNSAVEGIAGKSYAIPDRRVGQVYLDNPAVIGFWRSVGHSMNDCFYESFLDELSEAGGVDPLAMRRGLLTGNARLLALLDAVEALSGGWKPGPYEDGGVEKARGIAMASPFGSEVATIAEVSRDGSGIRVHRIWSAIDPGSVVNPQVVQAQVRSAVALGLSQALIEEVVYENGAPAARNFDMYPILTRDMMPEIEVAIVESGAPMGGVGEPGLPSVAPAVVNAAARLTGVRARSLPLSHHDFSSKQG